MRRIPTRTSSLRSPWKMVVPSVAAALAITVVASQVPVGAAPGAAAPSSHGCADAVVREPAPLARAIARTPAPAAVKAAIQDVNDLTRRELNRAVADSTLWVDSCGALFFVDVTHPHADADTHETAQAAPQVDAASVPANVLDLSSRPESDHTIYLDFTGGTVSGTAWNTPQWTGSYGTPIDVTPYSITTPADLNFTAAERAEIYTAWAAVAEDYAPFDVNVTTLPPSTDALTRYSLDDPTYGVTVKITSSGPIYASCGCGGIAYLDIFSEVGSQTYNPAWVFTAGTTTSGYALAQAASHEVGHTFGLSHDATDRADYYNGSGAYGALMGASYGRRVSHWSIGEYPTADNYEDDVAIIASQAPKLFDDHGDNAQDATPIATGETLDGLIGDRTDVDAFSFTGEGRVTFTAAGPAGVSNTDLQIRVLNASGAQVALVNPVSPAGSLDATWTANLPRNPGRYTAIVDGVGNGTPSSGVYPSGQYSDYGSMGRYTVNLDVSVDPMSVQALTPTISGTVDSPLSSTPTVNASGGVTPYTYSATGLPAGWTMDRVTGRISGTPTDPADTNVTVTVTDAYGRTASAVVRTVVDDLPPVTVQATTPTLTGTAGQPLAPTTVVAVAGGRAPYTYSATGLPTGWTISSSTGQISGTASTAQTQSATITATDARGRTGQVTISTVVNAPAPLNVQATGTLTGTAGTLLPATSVVAVTGGRAPYAYSVTGLPSGWSMSSSSGQVSGTTAAAFTGTAKVTVTDANGATAQVNVNVVVDAAPVPPVDPLVLNPLISTLTGTAGKEIAGTPTVAAAGGVAPYTFSASGLPVGLGMDADTGIVSGVPIAASVGLVTITVADSRDTTQNVTIAVAIGAAPTLPPPPLAPATPPPPLPIDPGDEGGAGPAVELEFVTGTSLPGARKGKRYSATIKVTGPSVKSWTITKVKNGLKVTPKGSKAKVTGKPAKAGKVRFAVTVWAVDGQRIKQTFTIAVR